ncbi:hypothetical protein SAMN05660776_1975 [Salegentibacter holothuriorum]|uniref:Uncharacterized protein n=1 Tax=Salegentibacter holothuriorum TaxID=241145 RepID=A0A1T5CJB5_9FLAO|nr:hypothetical protein [Salegentibacter holothuriorum]SKB59514.1 hypothetical protein SAMN05660776_1975 [Salegentibacter holothuriorum]
MKFKITIFFLSLLVSVSAFAQEVFDINVFVDADKNIYLEEQKLSMSELLEETKALVYKQSAMKYNRLVYNIYADKNLKHGFIMDINHQLLRAVEGLKSKTNKYHLEYESLDLDEAAWQLEIKALKLEAIED